MKTSNKMLLVVALLPFLFITGLMVSMKISFEKHRDEFVKTEISDKLIQKEFPLSDFHRIHVSGMWDLKISRGEKFQIRVEAPENMMWAIEVNKEEDQLRLRFIPDYFEPDSKEMPKATIVMPSISAIDVWQICRLELKGFKSSQLNLASEGNLQVAAFNTDIDNLDMVCKGVANCDFSQSSVQNARVRMDGPFSIKLAMTGGRLTGTLDGVGTLNYSGKADTREISVTNPLSRIVQLD